MLWVAVAASVSSAGGSRSRQLLAWASPAFTATLLLKLSGVPLVEAAGRRAWGGQPAYEHYVKHTSVLVPWLPAPPFAGAAPEGMTEAAKAR